MKSEAFHKTYPDAELIGANPDGDKLYRVEELGRHHTLYAVEAWSDGHVTLVEIGDPCDLPTMWMI